MAKQTKQQAKGRKIGRNKKHQATLYLSGDRWNVNRKRAMKRHIRDNPRDEDNRAAYAVRYGKPESLGLSARGKQLAARYTLLRLTEVML